MGKYPAIGVLMVLCLCQFFVLSCGDDDDDDSASGNDDDEAADDDAADDDNTTDDDSTPDDDTSPSDGTLPVAAVSRGNFLVFHNLLDPDRPLPALRAETDLGLLEQLIGGLSGEKFLNLAFVPSVDVTALTELAQFSVRDAAFTADAAGNLHLAIMTNDPRLLQYGTIQNSELTIAQTWSFAANVGFFAPSIVVDSENRPHIFYQEGVPPVYALRHLFPENGVWQSQTIYDGDVVEYQVVCDAQGVLHAVVLTEDAVLYGNDRTGVWQYQTVLDDYHTPFYTTSLRNPCIAINGEGLPVVAVVYSGRRVEGFIEYLFTHLWFAEQIDAGSELVMIWQNDEFQYRQLAMAIDGEGRPHLVLAGDFQRHLWYEGDQWNEEYLAFESTDHLQLARDEQNDLYLVAYGQIGNSDQPSVIYRRYRDGVWNETTRVGGDGFTMRAPLLVQRDDDDTTHIIARGDGIYYISGDGDGWASERVADNWEIGAYYSLMLDSADLPHLIYSYMMTVVHAYRDDGEWPTETLFDPYDDEEDFVDDDFDDDDDVDPIRPLTATIAPDENFHMVYKNVVTENLDLLTKTGNDYLPLTLANFPGTQSLVMQLFVDGTNRNHLLLRRGNSVEYFTDAFGEWEEYVVFADEDFYANPPNDFDGQFDENGTLHIAFYDVAEEKLAYVYGTPGDWNLSYPDGGEECKLPKIALDDEYQAHLLCRTNDYLLYLVGEPGNWISAELPIAHPESLFDLTVDENGELSLFYIEEDALTVVTP